MRWTAALVLIGVAGIRAQGVPEWQLAAGGKQSFEVASVKPSTLPRLPNFPLDTGNAVTRGGRLSATFPVWVFVTFAYKLRPTDEQTRIMLANAPSWVVRDLFEFDARAPGDATKDQLRLMMQSLLAERFNLAIHFDTREVPALELALVSHGKLGPKLRPHSQGPPCSEFEGPTMNSAMPKPGEVFPARCDVGEGRNVLRNDIPALAGRRNAPPAVLADDVYGYGSLSGEVDKPVVDRTGLSGTYDYTIEWTNSANLTRLRPPGAETLAPAESGGGKSFLQALRQQLGLKLVPIRAPIRILIIDHIERPSEN